MWFVQGVLAVGQTEARWFVLVCCGQFNLGKLTYVCQFLMGSVIWSGYCVGEGAGVYGGEQCGFVL